MPHGMRQQYSPHSGPPFRDPGNLLPGILVPTQTVVEGEPAYRVFLLEQPQEGFSHYNYSWATPTLRSPPPPTMRSPSMCATST